MADPRLGTLSDHIANLSGRVSNNTKLEDPVISSRPNSVEDVLRLACCVAKLPNPSKRPSKRLVKHKFQTWDGSALPPLPITMPLMRNPVAESETSSSLSTSSKYKPTANALVSNQQ